MKEFDYLIVGAGLYGAVFAHELTKRGKSCFVLDKRSHLGGNVYCENVHGINVHKYGAHIFHTNDKEIWEYVNSFVPFNNYINSPLAMHGDRLYNLPFNMNTFYQLWGVKTPEEAKRIIGEQTKEWENKTPSNLEEQAISMVGIDIYEKLIRGYTEKQWGRSCRDLPSFIIKRLPLRFTYNNNYFNDRYQGIPEGGYNRLIDGLLKNIPVALGADFFSEKSFWQEKANKIVYTGKIDEFYGFRFGYLEYRSLDFVHETIKAVNYQGNAVINYTDRNIPFTRILEHKHFEFGTQPVTVITKEYPVEWRPGAEAYYPVNDEKNTKRFKQYEAMAKQESEIIFGGRLAEYRYYDMHQVVGAALSRVNKILNEPHQS